MIQDIVQISNMEYGPCPRYSTDNVLKYIPEMKPFNLGWNKHDLYVSPEPVGSDLILIWNALRCDHSIFMWYESC